MSDEGGKFTPRKQPKFPALILRAYVGPKNFVEWILTPPDDAGWFDYKFEAKQETGILYVDFDQTMMKPRLPE